MPSPLSAPAPALAPAPLLEPAPLFEPVPLFAPAPKPEPEPEPGFGEQESTKAKPTAAEGTTNLYPDMRAYFLSLARKQSRLETSCR